jgi:two-component system, cell cycle sensor histidine kinase and response regulator CckA
VRENASGEASEGPVTILVVEDGTAVRKAVCFILQKSGYRVLEASDAREARQVFGRHEGPVRLLLTDVEMPGGSGPELARELGSVSPEMRVLYVSGYSDSVLRNQEGVGPDAPVLRKPFAMEDLVAKVRDVLGAERPDGRESPSHGPAKD